VVSEPPREINAKLVAFGGSTVEVPPPKAEDLEVQYGLFLARVAGPISPWVDAKPNAEGQLQLPEYRSERSATNPNTWVPGEFTEGVDNIERDADGSSIKEWGGMKMPSGPLDITQKGDLLVDPTEHPEHIQRLMKVPHMPGQPVKEMWARLKAAEPRLFEDPDFVSVSRNLPENWKSFVAYTTWSESCGINSESVPAEWKGQELACVPAVYLTPRNDIVSICVGVATPAGESAMLPEAPGAEYDFLEYLYAKDQEGKVIQIQEYKCQGIEKISFAQFSFVPPKGTTAVIPYACFKLRGVWVGERLAWDATIENPDMQWFTDMPYEQRKELGDVDKIEQSESDLQGQPTRKKKTTKQMPRLWPENSWEGNAAKARVWDLDH
jgi:hypothetical protein